MAERPSSIIRQKLSDEVASPGNFAEKPTMAIASGAYWGDRS